MGPIEAAFWVFIGGCVFVTVMTILMWKDYRRR